MSKKLLNKVQVASGKTAGIVARHTLAIADRARSMPGVIKAKTAETIQVTGKVLRIKRLRRELKKRQQKRLFLFTKFGKAIFKSVRTKARNIWRRKDIERFLPQFKKCEAEIGWIKAQINEIEERGKEQTSYYEAIVNLNSKEKDVRLSAVRFLGEIGEKDLITILAKRLEDRDLKVRQEAVRVLHKIIDKASPESGRRPIVERRVKTSV